MININLGNQTRAKIISAVIGQLSDGMWENSPRMNKYWRFAQVKGVELQCNDEHWESGFRGKSEEDIKHWFALKLKAVVQDEVGNNKSGWSRDNMRISDYISYHNDITVSHCYECYDFLLGRSGHVYAYQLDENKPEYIRFKKAIAEVLVDAQDELHWTSTPEYREWMDSVISYYMSQFKDLSRGGFNEEAYAKLHEDNVNQERYEFNWPNTGSSAEIIDSSLRKDSNFYIELTQNLGLTMSPADCIRACWFGKIREKVFDRMYSELTGDTEFDK